MWNTKFFTLCLAFFYISPDLKDCRVSRDAQSGHSNIISDKAQWFSRMIIIDADKLCFANLQNLSIRDFTIFLGIILDQTCRVSRDAQSGHSNIISDKAPWFSGLIIIDANKMCFANQIYRICQFVILQYFCVLYRTSHSH